MQLSPNFYLNSLKSYKGKHELFIFWKRWWNANSFPTYYNPCSHKNFLVLSVFLLFPTSSQSRMGGSHTHGHMSLHSSPKTTRYTPKVAVFCFVRLLMLISDPSIEICICRAVFCSFLPQLSLGWAYCTPTAVGAPHGGPKITRGTPKIATICFVCLLMLVYNPPTKITLCRSVFCSYLPHLSLGWEYCTPMAIGAPTAGQK